MNELTQEQIEIGKTFNDKEKSFYDRNRKAGFTPQESFNLVLKAYKKDKAPEGSVITRVIKDIPSDVAQTVRGVGSAIGRSFTDTQQTITQANRGEISTPTAQVSMLGSVGRGVGQVAGELFLGAGRLALTPEAEESVLETTQNVLEPVVTSQPVQNLISRYESLNPEQKSLVDGALGITEGLTTVLGGGQIARGAVTGARTAISSADDLVRNAVANARIVAGDLTRGIGETVSETVKKTSSLKDLIGKPRIQSRVATNIRDRIDTNRAINELPTPTAQNAVRDGIEIRDVNTLLEVSPKLDKTLGRELFERVKETDAGSVVDEPIEIVGRPIVDRIKLLDSEANRVGQELGEVAKTLGRVTKTQLTKSVLDRLKKASGLQELRLNKNGTLDFSRTNLTSRATLSDRNAIQDAFTNAVRGGSGQQAHRFRQELFEVLDGKKRSLENITGTQERALNAIRQGIADVLDAKNPQYKALSQDYAEIMRPLGEIRKKIKALNPDLTDDILEMNAGIIARRLTGTSISRGEIKNLLRQLDEVSDSLGSTAQSTEALQDLYNVLNNYYQIAPPTGFQGGIESAIDTSVGGFVGRNIRDVAGQTPAVRQQALENLLTELLQ